MTIQLDSNLLFSTFNVSSFYQLEQEIQSLAPSMVEYYLNDLSSSEIESVYINRSNIQQTIFFNEYSLYLDYSDSIYLEFVEKEDDYNTQSLW